MELHVVTFNMFSVHVCGLEEAEAEAEMQLGESRVGADQNSSLTLGNIKTY